MEIMNLDLKNVGVFSNVGLGKYVLEDKDENSIYITEQDETYSTKITKTILTEGDYPKNSNELILNNKTKDYLGINLGDNIKLREVQFDENGKKHF